MSMIEQQLKEIRDMTSVLHDEKRYAAEEIMRQAADTIEALSEKLAAANMEQSDRYYGGGLRVRIDFQSLEKDIWLLHFGGMKVLLNILYMMRFMGVMDYGIRIIIILCPTKY